MPSTQGMHSQHVTNKFRFVTYVRVVRFALPCQLHQAADIARRQHTAFHWQHKVLSCSLPTVMSVIKFPHLGRNTVNYLFERWVDSWSFMQLRVARAQQIPRTLRCWAPRVNTCPYWEPVGNNSRPIEHRCEFIFCMCHIATRQGCLLLVTVPLQSQLGWKIYELVYTMFLNDSWEVFFTCELANFEGFQDHILTMLWKEENQQKINYMWESKMIIDRKRQNQGEDRWMWTDDACLTGGWLSFLMNLKFMSRTNHSRDSRNRRSISTPPKATALTELFNERGHSFWSEPFVKHWNQHNNHSSTQVET